MEAVRLLDSWCSLILLRTRLNNSPFVCSLSNQSRVFFLFLWCFIFDKVPKPRTHQFTALRGIEKIDLIPYSHVLETFSFIFLNILDSILLLPRTSLGQLFSLMYVLDPCWVIIIVELLLEGSKISNKSAEWPFCKFGLRSPSSVYNLNTDPLHSHISLLSPALLIFSRSISITSREPVQRL